MLLLYCGQVALPILLSLSSAVVLVTIDALKVTQIKVASRANCKVVSPYIIPNEVWLSLFIRMCFNQWDILYNRKVNSHETGTFIGLGPMKNVSEP